MCDYYRNVLKAVLQALQTQLTQLKNLDNPNNPNNPNNPPPPALNPFRNNPSSLDNPNNSTMAMDTRPDSPVVSSSLSDPSVEKQTESASPNNPNEPNNPDEGAPDLSPAYDISQVQ